jgi:signal transduction histidine kinase
VITLVLGVTAGALHQPSQEVLFAVAFSAIPAGIVIAVVRYRLFDVEVVLNRTVVYGLLTSVVLAGYLAAVVGMDQAAQRTGLVVVVVLALLAAAARDRVQRGVDRLLFGYRRDPYAVVSRVGRRLDDASGPLDALRQLAVELRTVLRLPYAEVLPDDPGLPPVESGRSVAGTVDIPVTVQGQHVATLRVGRRHNGERFRPDELSALTDVARHAGALVQAAALIAELQRSRETLVAAREEERRRLRRDLHDGVGPELAGLALQLDSLAGRLAADTDLADRARVLRDRMRQTVAGVRRVVDDLRPPALDELGLADALRQHLAAYAVAPAGTSAAQDAVRVTVTGTLPPLPAAVEVAAYRIVGEAVANAFRHGQATMCTVQLSANDDHLHLEVCDDGTGIPPAATPGIGLASMRDRAAELGGELSIETGTSGTTVRGRLPLRFGP